MTFSSVSQLIIFGSETDHISLLILFLFFFLLFLLFLLLFFLLGDTSKKPKLCRFKSDRGEIRQDCSSSIHASIDESDF